MSQVTEDEFIDIASRMAQELQDVIADAETAGCVNPFPGVKELIDEWESIYIRTHPSWQKEIVERGSDEEKKVLDVIAREHPEAGELYILEEESTVRQKGR